MERKEVNEIRCCREDEELRGAQRLDGKDENTVWGEKKSEEESEEVERMWPIVRGDG